MTANEAWMTSKLQLTSALATPEGAFGFTVHDHVTLPSLSAPSAPGASRPGAPVRYEISSWHRAFGFVCTEICACAPGDTVDGTSTNVVGMAAIVAAATAV